MNFKEILSRNHYLQENEEKAFLEWLQETLDYEEGVLTLHEEYINYESEVPESSNPYLKLKTLVKEWSRSKYEKQDYWNKLYDLHLGYLEGSLYLEEGVVVNEIMNVSHIRIGDSVYLYIRFDNGGRDFNKRILFYYDEDTTPVEPVYSSRGNYTLNNTGDVMQIKVVCPSTVIDNILYTGATFIINL